MGEYITKPINADILLQIIGELMRTPGSRRGWPNTPGPNQKLIPRPQELSTILPDSLNGMETHEPICCVNASRIKPAFLPPKKRNFFPAIFF
jgi:hypothetical protein